jgi:CxxC motif-containing protein (DUF1111 family)
MDRRMTHDTGGKMTRISKLTSALALSVAAILLTSNYSLWAQTASDPGVRGGAAGAGTFQAALTSFEQDSECPAQQTFVQTINVPANSSSWVTNNNCAGSAYPVVIQSGGLGPAFNSNSCSSCHSQPAMGGSSPQSNPLFAVYNLMGAKNGMPFFEKKTGPILIARFPYQLNDLSLPDGFVHQLFTTSGRSDSGGCTLGQPNFKQASTDNDVVYRQPSPLFGDGYIEMIENTDIINNLNANLTQKQALGIGGVAQITDDGSVSRLGWKSQWRAILPAVGSEENVELGLTNEMFPTETNQTLTNCLTNPVPEDVSNYTYWSTNGGAWNFDANAGRNAVFVRFLEQPTPACTIGQDCSSCPNGGISGGCANGYTQFNTVGCNLCHTVSFTTPAGSIPSMGHITANLLSDLLLHHMGSCVADNITQGSAQGDMFRTPPLWNVGQRYYFMHDGRTSNIVTAIEEHALAVTGETCTGSGTYPASEASAVVAAFNKLSPTNQQDLVNFLRSL